MLPRGGTPSPGLARQVQTHTLGETTARAHTADLPRAMPIRTASDHTQYDASVQQSVQGVHDRDPLLIPQLFEDTFPPWYRRRSGQVLIALLVLCLSAAALVVVLLGVDDIAERLGRLGLSMLRTFANIAGG